MVLLQISYSVILHYRKNSPRKSRKYELWTRVDGVHLRTYIFNSYSNGGRQQKMVRVLICPCPLFINDYTEWWELWYATRHQWWRDAQRLHWDFVRSRERYGKQAGRERNGTTQPCSQSIGMNQHQDHATGMGMIWAGNTVDCSRYYDGKLDKPRLSHNQHVLLTCL